jgi:hypothetical protein
MKMVRHDADAKHFYGEFSLGGSEQIEKGRVVAVFVKNRCATVSSIQNMVGVSTDLSAWDARHVAHSTRTSIFGARKSSLSPL